jgi:hypothetical protein
VLLQPSEVPMQAATSEERRLLPMAGYGVGEAS